MMMMLLMMMITIMMMMMMWRLFHYVCRFTVTSGMVEPFLEGISLQEALETNRIFIVDLELLARLSPESTTKHTVSTRVQHDYVI